MKKINIIITAFGILVASALMIFFTPKQTPLAFVGWMIFFAAIAFPTVFLSEKSNLRCYFTRK